MTKKVLIQSQELERAAEKAGGYVAPPGSLRNDSKKKRDFSAMRQYSLKTKKPISQFTDEDYKKLGIKRLVD